MGSEMCIRDRVRGIPTLLLFKNAELVSTKVGAFPKLTLLEWIDENI